jgi:hypothetical protein
MNIVWRRIRDDVVELGLREHVISLENSLFMVLVTCQLVFSGRVYLQ